MKQTDFFLLLLIAKKAGLNNQFHSSTSEIAKQSNLSQQSVSRKLILLEKNGLLKRVN